MGAALDAQEPPAVTKRPSLIIPAVALGIIFIVIALVYWIEPAKSLPSFFPGHQAGSSTHHTKHGIAAFLLGVACFVFAWFQTGGGSSRVPA
jgi:drug/metabolite transporter (DMT)-like permease